MSCASLMKKWLCCLLAVMLLPSALAGAEEASHANAAAHETEATVWVDGKALTDPSILRDGDDATACTPKKNKTVTLTVQPAEGDMVAQVYLRMRQLPVKAELQTSADGRKWQTVCEKANPGPEFVLALPDPTDRVRVALTFAKTAPAAVTELRAFGSGSLPEALHAWRDGEADVLLLADGMDDVNADALADWAAQGRTVAVACLSAEPEGLLDQMDAWWDAGLRTMPLWGDFRAMEGSGEARLKTWTEKSVAKTLTSWIRRRQPLLAVSAGEAASLLAEQAALNARNYRYELSDAAAWGLCVVPFVENLDAVTAERLASLPERSDAALRAWCAQDFASALHGDPATIPYPAERLGDGYLPSGEFLHEDPENGLWAYLSSTVQVEIIRYEQPEIPRVWFVTDLHFKPESEKFQQVVYANATFKGQQIYPETLAQTSNMVLAINGDYYPYRVDKKQGIGNILRQGKALYNHDPRRSNKYPNLDTMALTDAGTLEVYRAGETTASALEVRGDVHDALSFGPYLARDGHLRIYDGNSCDASEPRTAMGMIAPGHFCLVTVEGRMPKPEHQGMNLNELGMLLYAQGVTDSFSLDGGSTSVLVFMGKKLNVTGKGTSTGPARNQHELFGVGTSELTHTDKIDKR